MAGKSKPKRRKSLAEQRADDFAAVGLSPEAAALVKQAEVEIVRAGHRRGQHRVDSNVAWRSDPFITLRSGMAPGAYDAVRRLERDMMTRLGEGDGKPLMERVDGDPPKGSLDIQVAAGRRVEWIKDRLSETDWWLLHELIAPTGNYEGWTPVWKTGGEIRQGTPLTGWHAVVGYIRGELTAHGRAAAVRTACANLKDAWDRYDDWERQQKRKAA